MHSNGRYQQFWLVWSPTGTHPPRHRHPTVDAANLEACRLAREHRGAEFYVLEAQCLAIVRDVSLIDLQSGDEIPF